MENMNKSETEKHSIGSLSSLGSSSLTYKQQVNPKRTFESRNSSSSYEVDRQPQDKVKICPYMNKVRTRDLPH